MNPIAAYVLVAFTLATSACSTAKNAYAAYNRIPREARIGYDQQRGAYGEMVWKFGGSTGKAVVPTQK